MALIKAVPTVDYANLIRQGLGAFQQVQGIQRGAERADQEKRVRELRSLAASDPAALQELAMIDPQSANVIQQMQAQKQKLQGQRQIQDLSGQALQDPQALSQLAALAPQRATQLQGFQGAQTKASQEIQGRFERERAQTAALIKDAPLGQQIKTLDWRIDMINSRGGDPSNTVGLRDMLASGDPQAIAQGQGAINNAYQLGIMQKHIDVARPEGRTSLIKNLEAAGIDPKSEQGRKLILADISGQQISFTGPDGTEFTIGKGVGGKGGDITKKTKGELEKTLVAGERQLISLDRLDNQFNKDFLTYQGRGQAFLSGIKSKAGVGLSGDEKSFLKNRRRFTQNVNRFFNAYRKDITGAAASVQELESLKKAVFNEDLSPDEFKGAFDEFKSELLRAQRLNRRLLREGVVGNPKNRKSEAAQQLDALFLAGEDDLPVARVTELMREGKTQDEIQNILEQEGYSF